MLQLEFDHRDVVLLLMSYCQLYTMVVCATQQAPVPIPNIIVFGILVETDTYRDNARDIKCGEGGELDSLTGPYLVFLS